MRETIKTWKAECEHFERRAIAAEYESDVLKRRINELEEEVLVRSRSGEVMTEKLAALQREMVLKDKIIALLERPAGVAVQDDNIEYKSLGQSLSLSRREVLRQGGKIPAIKYVREKTGAQLKEAVDWVNAHFAGAWN